MIACENLYGRTNSAIWKLIRKKNRIHIKARRSNSPSDWNKFRRIRNDVTNLVRTSKEEHKNNLIKKLINENSSGSNWWKSVKQLNCGWFFPTVIILLGIHNSAASKIAFVIFVVRSLTLLTYPGYRPLIYMYICTCMHKLIRKKNRMHRKARRSNSPSDWNKFRRIRNDVPNLMRKSKEEHKNNLIKKMFRFIIIPTIV
jgi:uncharacterized protein with NRDE domain